MSKIIHNVPIIINKVTTMQDGTIRCWIDIPESNTTDGAAMLMAKNMTGMLFRMSVTSEDGKEAAQRREL